MNRKEFVKLTTGIISGLGIHNLFDDGAKAEGNANSTALDDSYLVNGLTGMAKANGWFDAHWGAGILAGYYLCKENRLDEETVAGLAAQSWFPTLLVFSGAGRVPPGSKAPRSSLQYVGLE